MEKKTMVVGVIVILAVIAALLYVKRRKISEKIAGYVIKHTDLEMDGS